MKPILFNTENVKALLADRKTATRRVAFPEGDLSPFRIKQYPEGWWFRGRVYRNWDDAMKAPQGVMSLCKYHPSDILYVRETWAFDTGDEEDEIGTGYFAYKADCEESLIGKWRPSIHMPKIAARIFLRVTDLRVERLQDISGGDLLKEGIDLFQSNFAKVAFNEFENLWNSTLKPKDLPLYGWEANPWVWVIEFERISKKEASL